jgi:hypothetical protein
LSFKSSQGSCKFLKTRFLKTPPCSTGTGAVRSPGVPGSPRGSLGPLGSVLRRFRKLLRVFRVFFRRKAIEKVRESRRKFETVRDSSRQFKKAQESIATHRHHTEASGFHYSPNSGQLGVLIGRLSRWMSIPFFPKNNS